MTVTFNTILADIRTPGAYIEFDNSRAVQGVGIQPHKTLVIGHRLAAGTVAEQIPTSVASKDKAEEYFGHGSQLADMIEYYKLNDPYTELWAIALDDGAGVDATGSFAFASTATAAGTVHVYIGGEHIEVAVAKDDTHTEIAVALDAAIDTHLTKSNLPVVPSNATGTLTITALHAGTNGNDIDLRLNHNQGEALPAGITCVVTGMASGATDPDTDDAIAAMGDVQYNTIVTGLNVAAEVAKLETELDTRWGGMVMQEGMAFYGALGSQAALTALGNARNSQHSVLMGGGESPTPSWRFGAAAGAISATEAQKDPARPFQTLKMLGMVVPKPDEEFTRAERNILLTDGVSTYTIVAGVMQLERLITTYQLNGLGNPDVSYLDVMTPRTLAAMRYSQRVRITSKYPRHKLSDDGPVPSGQAIVTPGVIKGELIALASDWQDLGWMDISDDAMTQFKTDLVVERSTTDVNRVDVLQSPDLINQFMVYGAQMQFLL